MKITRKSVGYGLAILLLVMSTLNFMVYLGGENTESVTVTTGSVGGYGYIEYIEGSGHYSEPYLHNIRSSIIIEEMDAADGLYYYIVGGETTGEKIVQYLNGTGPSFPTYAIEYYPDTEMGNTVNIMTEPSGLVVPCFRIILVGYNKYESRFNLHPIKIYMVTRFFSTYTEDEARYAKVLPIVYGIGMAASAIFLIWTNKKPGISKSSQSLFCPVCGKHTNTEFCPDCKSKTII